MKLFELFATLSLETKEFVRGVNTAGKQAQGLAANVQNKVSAATVAIGNLAARGVEKVAQAGVKVVRDSLDVVKEFEQNLGGSEAVFGQWADTVQKMGSTAYKTMGLSLSDYLSTANQMGSLFKGAGYTTSEAMDMTTKAMQRAADVASIMGIDAEWAMESVAGLAKGNFTMMDNLGVAINDTTLANYALEKGIKKSTSAMSTQEKVALALELFLERTAEYAGNYAKENNTLAGSYEVVAAAYENMLIGQEGSTEAFVDAVGIAAKATLKNLGEIIPRLGRSMQIALQKAGPQLESAMRDTWDNKLPGLVTSGANKIISGINSIFGTNIPTIEKIELPAWGDIETSVSTWWTTIKVKLPAVTQWTLNLFENPSEGAGQIATAVSTWWTGTAEPAIKGVSTWALNLFGVPIEEDASIATHVGTWWKGKNSLVSNACSWVLQLFGMPTESAETITSTVTGWWDDAVDLVVGACNWILSQPEFPSVADMVIAVGDWWNDEVLPAIPEMVATAKVNIQTYTSDLATGLGIAFGTTDPSTVAPDVISSATIYEETGGQWGYPKATGLKNVPYNNYPALLHEGEAVLTKNEATTWRREEGLESTRHLESLMEIMVAKMDALGNMVVVLDGGAVGRAVAPTVSRQIIKDTKSKYR